MLTNVEIIKNNGDREIFDASKLRQSLERAGATLFVINDIVKSIEESLKDGMTTTEIYKAAFKLLKEKGDRSAARYSLRRSILSLGPTGFPFEDFVASVLRAKGYKTVIGQLIKGKCVEHEVDIMAYNDSDLILCETKFHNEHNTKSDTKIALYIKARFDDLQAATIKIDGKDRKMTRGMLITNTKFTDSAKKYGKCAGTFDMISWEYPEKGNLYDLIEETKMHPITCIPELSKHDKRELLERGVSTCASLKENTSVLQHIGMDANKISNITDNIDIICSHNHN